MREANDAKYAQIRQRHLDAIVQSMIPSIDNTRASEVWRRTPVPETSEVSTGEIDQLAQQIRKISSSIATQEDLQKAIDAYTTAVTDKFQAMLSDIWNRIHQSPRHVIQVNTAFQGTRHCLACFGRDKNGAIDPNCNHTNSNDCPLMQELINTSCIHRSGYSWCKGKWDPNRPSIPFILRKNRRWYDQFKAQLQGRPYMGARIANGPRF